MKDRVMAPEAGVRRRGRFAKFQAWLGIILSLVCLTWLVFATDWVGVWRVLTRVNYWLVAAAMALNLVTVLFRTARWRLLCHTRRVPAFGRLIAALLAGQAVNVLVPARLGDLARATLVGTGETAYALGTLVLEIALDLLMLAALVLLLLSQATLPAWWRGSGRALVVTATLALAAVVALVCVRRRVTLVLDRLSARQCRPWVRRAFAAARQLLLSLETLGRPAQLLPALAWSVLIWALYGGVNVVLLAAVGEQPSVLVGLFLLAVLQLGVAVPSSPGRVGVFHYLCVQALAVFGIVGPQAISYAVILHLISVVVPMAMGAILAWRLGVLMWRVSEDAAGA